MGTGHGSASAAGSAPRPTVVLLGAPGAGKGTQAKLLAEREGLDHLSTGEVLRQAIAEGSELGRRVRETVEAGRLVDDATVTRLVADRLDGTRAVLLDGFPRSVAQAELLEQLLSERGLPPPRVVEVVVDEELLVRRLAARRTCPACGPRPGGERERCGSCGEALAQRRDDSEEVVRERMRVHEAQAAPLADWYARRGLLARVDGEGTPEEVAARIAAAVSGGG